MQAFIFCETAVTYVFQCSFEAVCTVRTIVVLRTPGTVISYHDVVL